MEGLQHLALQGGIEVNQDIAAGNQIEAQEGWIADQVVPGEHDHVAQNLAGLEGIAGRLEIAFELLRRNLAHRCGRIDAAAGNVQCFVVYVSGKDLDAVEMKLVAQFVGTEHGNRIGLFATGAAGNPYADFVSLVLAPDHFLDGPAQDGECLTVAEEGRYRNKDVACQMVQFVRVSVDPFQITGQIMAVGRGLTAPDPAHQSADLVAGKIELQAFAQQGKEILQQIGRWLEIAIRWRCVEQLWQEEGDFFWRQDMVGNRCLDGGSGHPIVLCRFRFLSQRESAGGLNGPQAGYAIRAGTRQHDASCRLACFGRE